MFSDAQVDTGNYRLFQEGVIYEINLKNGNQIIGKFIGAVPIEGALILIVDEITTTRNRIQRVVSGELSNWTEYEAEQLAS